MTLGLTMVATVTKLEAASRQLDTAIRLFFAGDDAISVHTLAVAAANIFADIAEHRNAGVSWRTRTRDDSGLTTAELKRILHEEWNFFKHADRKPESTLTFKGNSGQGQVLTLPCSRSAGRARHRRALAAARPRSRKVKTPVSSRALFALRD